MPTDDERREMAAKIRNEANRRKADLGYDPDYSPFAALAVMSIGFHSFPRYEDLLHLAGLIEPESERTCRMVDNGVELCCSECDRRHGYDDEPQFCMGCGAKVVS